MIVIDFQSSPATSPVSKSAPSANMDGWDNDDVEEDEDNWESLEDTQPQQVGIVDSALLDCYHS